MADYYVATTGNDTTGTGSGAAPWRTLGKALTSTGAGDTILMVAGTYNEKVKLTSAGSALAGYKTIRPDGSDVVIMDGTGLGTGVVMLEATDCSYLKIQDLWIKNFNGAGIRVNGGTTQSHIRILDNEISNSTFGGSGTDGHAIVVHASVFTDTYYWGHIEQVVIDGNYIHDTLTGEANGVLTDECLTVAWEVERFQITNNVIDNTNRIGMDLIGKKTWLNMPVGGKFPRYGRVASNVIRNSGAEDPDAMFYVDGAKDVVYENNQAINNNGIGYLFGAEQLDGRVERCLNRWNIGKNNSARNIYYGKVLPGADVPVAIRYAHNTWYNDVANSTDVAGIYRTGDDCKIYNTVNVLGHSPAVDGIFLTSADVAPNPTLDFNAYYPEAANHYFMWRGDTYDASLALWQTRSGQGASSIVTNPLLTDPANEDFTLQAGSPCIETGRHLTVTTDAGTGTSLTVADPHWFFDGMQILDRDDVAVLGDGIIVGSSVCRIVGANKTTSVITVDRSITWSSGATVSYLYAGSTPDMGAEPYGTLPTVGAPGGSNAPINIVPGPYNVTVGVPTLLAGLSVSHASGTLSEVAYDGGSTVTVRVGALGPPPTGVDLDI